MLNKFEFVTSSPNIKSFDSCMKQNVGQLLAVRCWSPKRNSKKMDFLNMEPSESRKNDNFGKSSKFPGIPAGNFSDRVFPGIPKREFLVALCIAFFYRSFMNNTINLLALLNIAESNAEYSDTLLLQEFSSS